MGRPTTSLLDRQRIAVAATELIRETGDFTLPALARKLHVQTASLYHHVSGREEIVELVREQVVSLIDVSAFGDQPWDDALLSWARSYYRAFASHHSTIASLATQAIREPTSLAMYEQAVTCLLDAGFPADQVMAIITSLESLVLGSALDAAAPTVMVVPNAHSPRLTEALAATPTDETRATQAFELGLNALIDGFRRLPRDPIVI